jgi:hypothetical protein
MKFNRRCHCNLFHGQMTEAMKLLIILFLLLVNQAPSEVSRSALELRSFVLKLSRTLR